MRRATFERPTDPSLAPTAAETTTRLPLHPLAVENTYGDPGLLNAIAVRGATFAGQLDVDVIVGAENAGIPLAAAVSLASGLPFAFVRKPGYVGHEDHERRVRGASVSGQRVLLVDDAVSQGGAIEKFALELRESGRLSSPRRLRRRPPLFLSNRSRRTFKCFPPRRNSECSSPAFIGSQSMPCSITGISTTRVGAFWIEVPRPPRKIHRPMNKHEERGERRRPGPT
jgi:hypothetical protein